MKRAMDVYIAKQAYADKTLSWWSSIATTTVLVPQIMAIGWVCSDIAFVNEEFFVLSLGVTTAHGYLTANAALAIQNAYRRRKLDTALKLRERTNLTNKQ